MRRHDRRQDAACPYIGTAPAAFDRLVKTWALYPAIARLWDNAEKSAHWATKGLLRHSLRVALRGDRQLSRRRLVRRARSAA